MLSGRRLDLLDPSPLDIEISDIAHGLARVARWNGQTHGDHAFSVAQHALCVETISVHLAPDLPPVWRLYALLHDASEYVMGDLISPFKAAVGAHYKTFENRLDTAVRIRFGIPPHVPAEIKRLIKRADLISAHMEATQLAGFSASEARQLFGRLPAGLNLDLTPLPTIDAQRRFLRRFKNLEIPQ